MMELVIDSFAGGGGASTGIRMALGRDPDIAINHDPLALAMHRINHPGTRHMVQDVATVDSVSMCAGLPIGMLWMSPDCTDHSKAKGAAPRRDGERTTRGIGWAIVGWVRALPAWQRPRVVFLENVEEYVDWGPLLPNGKRCDRLKGTIFELFIGAWRAMDYTRIEWRTRRAWISGSGTIRRRLFVILRRDGEPIVWPEPTHGNPNDPEASARIAVGELEPWVTAADSIDFSLPCPSIFETAEEIRAKWGVRAKRPLADKTEARIAKGVRRHVLDAARPYLVKVNHTHRDEARDRGIDLPLSALTGKRDDALVAPVVTYAQQGGRSRAADAPLHTITASPKDQNALVSAPLMTVYYGTDADGAAVSEPMRTDTAKPRFGLVDALATVPPFGPEHEARARQVADFLRRHGCWDGGDLVTFEVAGATLVLVDLGMRMLTPRERFNANGFPRDYIIDRGLDEAGNVVRFSLEQQGHMCGNAVCPTEAAALVAANYRPRDVAAPRRPRETAQASLFQEAAE